MHRLQKIFIILTTVFLITTLVVFIWSIGIGTLYLGFIILSWKTFYGLALGGLAVIIFSLLGLSQYKQLPNRKRNYLFASLLIGFLVMFPVALFITKANNAKLRAMKYEKEEVDFYKRPMSIFFCSDTQDAYAVKPLIIPVRTGVFDLVENLFEVKQNKRNTLVNTVYYYNKNNDYLGQCGNKENVNCEEIIEKYKIKGREYKDRTCEPIVDNNSSDRQQIEEVHKQAVERGSQKLEELNIRNFDWDKFLENKKIIQ